MTGSYGQKSCDAGDGIMTFPDGVRFILSSVGRRLGILVNIEICRGHCPYSVKCSK